MNSPFRAVWSVALVPLLMIGRAALADGPSDNVSDSVRPVPPPGIELTPEQRSTLTDSLAGLEREIDDLAGRHNPFVDQNLVDVRVLASAVRMALETNGFFDEGDLGRAAELLALGQQRAAELREGRAPWNEARGLVVRGYVSRIDGSVQPYGLIVPESYQAHGPAKHRLDIWFHGRGEKLSEVNFLADRQKNIGEFAPPNAFVLHPYGRYCNANKFAGEIDTFEALEDVKRRYHIDDDRILVRGFSMGGAACWQFAVHYPDQWCAANPGAGFAETPHFLRVFQQEDVSGVPDYERRLWHWYDCTDYAVNIANCPTVAYSGELDIQKQAADIMAEALTKEGLTLRHVIGPETKHSYHPQAKIEVEQALADIARRGRDRTPRRVRFQTYTLRYNQQAWVTLDALGEHWTKARVDGLIESESRLALSTENVKALTLGFASGECPLDVTRPVTITIDGEELNVPGPLSDRSWNCQLHRATTNGRETWSLGPMPEESAPRKSHGLQGPIDDAFLDAFLFVRPTGAFASDEIRKWTEAELAHAASAWRSQFRGVAPIKNDVDVTDEDIAHNNLVLWGDSSSNAVLKRVVAQLPIVAEAGAWRAGEASYPSEHHALLLIAPNPLNPRRYIVLNSGVTFREYDYLNNARQVAKLPDWAIVDVRTPANARTPGKVAAAGFFDEEWRLPPPSGK